MTTSPSSREVDTVAALEIEAQARQKQVDELLRVLSGALSPEDMAGLWQHEADLLMFFGMFGHTNVQEDQQ